MALLTEGARGWLAKGARGWDTLGMQRLLIHNARVLATPDAWPTGWLLTDGRTIKQMGPGERPDIAADADTQIIDAQGATLAPGFIDVHVHGAVGYEVMDADAQGLRAMARFYARHGVTAFLATTWTATGDAIMRALEVVSECLGSMPDGATVLGSGGKPLSPPPAGLTVICTVSLAGDAPSFAVRRRTYTPSAPNGAVVLAAWASPKVSVPAPGPLSLDQVIVTAPGGLGRPSSAHHLSVFHRRAEAIEGG